MRRTGRNATGKAAPLLAGLLALGCVIDHGNPSPRPAPSVRVLDHDNAMVVLGEREILQATQAGGSLTDLLRQRVPSLRVERSAQAGACPRLTLRGVRSIVLSSEPELYVNGIRVEDTCLLESLPPGDVRLVQVYGAGQSPSHTGFRPSPNGLILIYTK